MSSSRDWPRTLHDSRAVPGTWTLAVAPVPVRRMLALALMLTQWVRALARQPAQWMRALALVLTQSMLVLTLVLTHASAPGAEALPEYRLKALFVYNFVLLTEWPDDVGATLNLCIYGEDPFGAELDALRGKAVGERSLTVQRKAIGESLAACQIVFISPAARASLPSLLESLRGSRVLTIADSPGAARLGVALNLSVALDRVTFEANLPAARAAGLNLSSKLLRLATQVIQ